LSLPLRKAKQAEDVGLISTYAHYLRAGIW